MSDPRIDLLDQAAPRADINRLLARLDSTEVVVRAVPGQAATALSIVNLLARLIPNVQIDASAIEVEVSPFGVGSMSTLAESVAHAVRPSAPDRAARSLVIDVGSGSGGADLYVWADAWSLRLSPMPLMTMQDAQSIGPAAIAASALAAAEVARRVLPELPGVRLARPFAWNLIDYRAELAQAEVAPQGNLKAVLFGAGSVGSSLIYALLLSRAHGHVVTVDTDSLQPRNKLRYPLWIWSAAGPKVEWLASFSSPALRIEPIATSAADWIAQAGGVELAIAAVDNAEARRDVVDLLARMTLNAGVDGLQLHVAAHRLGDGFACVYCPYVDVSDAADQVEVYVGLTGIGRARVAELLAGDALSERDVAAMAAAGRLKSLDADLIGGRLMDLARHRLYAQAAARVGVTTLAVSAPYVSAMAGALLAAEVMKVCAGSASVVDRRVDVDCSGYPTGFTSRPGQDPAGRCLCHNPVRQKRYRQRWITSQ